MRNYLFDSVTADDLSVYTSLAADFSGAPIENIDPQYLDWSELQEQRRALRAMRGELGEVSNLTAEQRAALKVAATALQAINTELDERTEAGSREARRTAGRKTSAGASDSLDRPLRDAGSREAMRTRFDGHDGRFAALFGPQRVSGAVASRFDTFGAFCAAVASGKPDNRLMAATMTESTGADGGFLVPVEYLGPLLDAALQVEKVRPYANVIPMTGKTAVAGLFDSTDGTNNARGGLRMLWGAEATALSEQKGKITDITLTAKKANIFVRVSRELVEDAVAFDRQLTAAMTAAVAAGLDSVAVNGTGAGQPLGVLNSGALISVTKESGQTSTNPLLLQNLAKMVGRLHPSSFARSRWLIHPTCVPSLYMMATTTMNLAGSENVGGGHVAAVTQDANGQLRIFGRPCDVSDACSVLGTAGDVILADWSRFAIGLRRSATIDKSEDRYFDSDEIAFRLTLRMDGQPADAAPTKLRDGANTTSAFIVTETR